MYVQSLFSQVRIFSELSEMFWFWDAAYRHDLWHHGEFGSKHKRDVETILCLTVAQIIA